MFDTLSERLRKTLGNLTGRGRISEADVDAAMREVRLALLEADVNFKVVKDFVARVRERAIGARGPREPDRRPAGRQDRQRRAGRAAVGAATGPSTCRATRRSSRWSACRARARRPRPPSSPATSSSRAAGRCSSPPTRTARPPPTSSRRSARASTSRSTARRSGTPVVDIARGGVEAAKRQVRDVVILDTAGRLTVDEALMAEIAAVNAAVKPVETLLVVDAMTGQEAVAVAQAFVAAVPVTGLILTKIDGDARGGAALSISRRHRRPGQVPGHRREDRRPRGLPPRPARRPDPRHGRHPDPRRAGPGARRRRSRPPSWRRSCARASFTLEDMLDSDPADPEDGPARPGHVDDPGHGQHGRRGPGRRRPRRPQADRGDHPGDDPRPSAATRPSSTARAGGASPPAPGTTLPDVNRLVKQFAEMQKLMKQLSGRRQAGRPRRLDGPAMSRRTRGPR